MPAADWQSLPEIPREFTLHVSGAGVNALTAKEAAGITIEPRPLISLSMIGVIPASYPSEAGQRALVTLDMAAMIIAQIIAAVETLGEHTMAAFTARYDQELMDARRFADRPHPDDQR